MGALAAQNKDYLHIISRILSPLLLLRLVFCPAHQKRLQEDKRNWKAIQHPQNKSLPDIGRWSPLNFVGILPYWLPHHWNYFKTPVSLIFSSVSTLFAHCEENCLDTSKFHNLPATTYSHSTYSRPYHWQKFPFHPHLYTFFSHFRSTKTVSSQILYQKSTFTRMGNRVGRAKSLAKSGLITKSFFPSPKCFLSLKSVSLPHQAI